MSVDVTVEPAALTLLARALMQALKGRQRVRTIQELIQELGQDILVVRQSATPAQIEEELRHLHNLGQIKLGLYVEASGRHRLPRGAARA